MVNQDKNTQEGSEKQEVLKEEPKTPVAQSDSQPPEVSIPDFSSADKIALIKFVAEISEVSNPLAYAKNASEAKHRFDEIVDKAYNEAKNRFLEGNEEADPADFQAPHDPDKAEFYNHYKKFRKKCNAFKKQLEQNKEENLKAKNDLLEKIKALTEQTETKDSFKKFKMLLRQWKQIGQIPASELENTWNKYHFYIDKFYDNLTLHSELKEIDRKKNLAAKKELLTKIQALNDEPDIEHAGILLQAYQDEWRQTGPVPKRFLDDLMVSYQNAVTKIYEKQEKHKEALEAQKEKNLEAKQEILNILEQFTKFNARTAKEWIAKNDELADWINKWRKIGPVPSASNNSVRKTFADLVKTFNNNKNQFFKDFKKERAQNIKERNLLCDKIEELLNKEDFFKYKSDVIDLQAKWKTIGPVPKAKSDKIWNRFKSICDDYFSKLTEYNKGQVEVYQANLKKKEAFCSEIEGMSVKDLTDEPEKIISQLQKKWHELGFVPLKDKEAIDNKFKLAIEKLINKLPEGQLKVSPALMTYKVKVESMLQNTNGKKQIYQEEQKLLNEIKHNENEVRNLERNLELFSAASGKGEKLLNDFKNKIENFKKKNKALKEKIELIKKVR